MYIYYSSSLAAWSGQWTFGWRSTDAIYDLEMVYVVIYFFIHPSNLIIIIGFYINLPIGAIVVVMLGFIRVPDQISKPKAMTVIRTLPSKLDLIGFALFAPAAIQLLLALQYGGIHFAWNSAQIIGLFCGAGATFIIFMAWEYYKGDAAMIPFSLVRRRTVWASCLVYGFMMAQLFCASYYLPIFFQGVKGVSPTLSGVYVLPGVLGQLFTAMSSGILGK